MSTLTAIVVAISICSKCVDSIMPMMGMGMGMGGGFFNGPSKMLGGGEESGGSFDENKKLFDNLFYKKFFGEQGMQFGAGNSGFGVDKGMMKNLKGDSGFYNNILADKNRFEDTKGYQGGQVFAKQGKNEDLSKAKKGQKKGRTVKGFHTTHESNEASNTEEVYDEEHDEADHKSTKGEQGEFGKNEEKSYEGEKKDAKFEAEQAKKEGNMEEKKLASKQSAEGGSYNGQKQVADGGSHFVKHNGDDVGGMGHHQANKMSKHYMI